MQQTLCPATGLGRGWRGSPGLPQVGLVLLLAPGQGVDCCPCVQLGQAVPSLTPSAASLDTEDGRPERSSGLTLAEPRGALSAERQGARPRGQYGPAPKTTVRVKGSPEGRAGPGSGGAYCKQDEVLLVVLPDAVVDPGTVVVHLPDAALTDTERVHRAEC